MSMQQGVAAEVSGGDVSAAGEARTELPGNAIAASAARRFVRVALAEWGLGEGPAADAMVLLVSELVTNAVVHAGTAVELRCSRLGGTLTAEVSDRHPMRQVRVRGAASEDPGAAPLPSASSMPSGSSGLAVPPAPAGPPPPAVPPAPPIPYVSSYGHGLRLVAAFAEEWGVSYRRDRKTVWVRLSADAGLGAPDTWDALESQGTAALPDVVRAVGGAALHEEAEAVARGRAASASASAAVQGPAPAWISHAALSFLAEASDLLAGQTDEDRVASLAGQLLVPRFADWCAVWLEGSDAATSARLARVWHSQENRMEELRTRLEKSPPVLAPHVLPGQAVPWSWPGEASAYGPGGASVACRLVVGERTMGTLVIGRAGLVRIADEVVGVVEDFARRVALALLAARRYTRQVTISKVLQRGLLPSGEVDIPGVTTAVVYEPAGEGSWAGGDFYDFHEVEKGRWRFALGDVCGNGPEAAVITGLARPVLRLLAREGYSVPQVLDRLNREVGEQARFLSVVYGELAPRSTAEGGGIQCTLTCAGHPLPLLLNASGEVRAAAAPQLLLGVVDEVGYDSQTFVLQPGDTLLCVTDGVTERRSGQRQFDDEDGLSTVLEGCAGLDAADTAERLRRAVHRFGEDALTDDLALMVLQACEK